MMREDQVLRSAGHATELWRHSPRGGDVRAVAGRYALVVALVFLIIAFSLLRPETIVTTATLQSILVAQTMAVVLALVRSGQDRGERTAGDRTGNRVLAACYGTTAIKPSTLPSNATLES
jgi:hypothetical protein